MQHRRQRLRQIGREIVPSFWNLRFVENELDFDYSRHTSPVIVALLKASLYTWVPPTETSPC
jgi:hypothetical protein